MCVEAAPPAWEYLGCAEPSCADVAGPKHLLIAQDAPLCVLLFVQELLEGAEAALGDLGPGNLLQ